MKPLIQIYEARTTVLTPIPWRQTKPFPTICAYLLLLLNHKTAIRMTPQVPKPIRIPANNAIGFQVCVPQVSGVDTQVSRCWHPGVRCCGPCVTRYIWLWPEFGCDCEYGGCLVSQGLYPVIEWCYTWLWPHFQCDSSLIPQENRTSVNVWKTLSNLDDIFT